MKWEYKKNICDIREEVVSESDCMMLVRKDMCKELADYLMSRKDLVQITIDDHHNVYGKINTEKLTDFSTLTALTYNNTEQIKSILETIKESIGE